MRRARRLPKRLVRLTTLSVCLALILIALAMAPLPNVNSRETSPQVQENLKSGSGLRFLRFSQPWVNCINFAGDNIKQEQTGTD